jgi:ComF family protein
MAIKSLKYRFIYDIAIYFKQDLEDFLIKNFSKKDCVLVPIPLHPKREKWRGFNQAEILIHGVSHSRNSLYYGARNALRPCAVGWQTANLLKRIRNTTPQAELEKHERLSNLNGAFAVRDIIPMWLLNKKIILIDDICTTGATMSECANVLRQAGAKEVYGLTLGHGG